MPESLGDVVATVRGDTSQLKGDIAAGVKGAFDPLEKEAAQAGTKASSAAGKKFGAFKGLVGEFAKGASGELASQLEAGGAAGASGAGKKMGLLRGFVANAARGASDELEAQLAAGGKAGGEKAGKTADEELTKAGKESGKHFGGGFADTFKGIVTGGAVLGAVQKVGSAIAGQLGEAINQSDATDKFKQTLAFAGQGKKQIAELTKSAQDYADKTVYNLDTIQNATAQLTANGIKNSDSLVKALGNLNAVAGGNADTFQSVSMVLTQTAGAGKLTTENWNQLADAIPGASGILQAALKKNGAYTGNFRDAMSKGEITAKEFNKAISDTGMTKAAQEAATSTKTIEGAVGNLQATLVGGLAKGITKLKPIITGGINLLSTGMGKAFDSVGTLAEGLGKKLEPAENAVKLFFGTLSGKGSDAPVPDSWMNPIIDAASTIANIFDSVKKIAKEAFAGLGDGLEGIDLSSIGEIVKAFSPLGGVIQGLLPALSQMGNMWRTLGGLIGDLVKQLVPILIPAIASLAKMIYGTLATAFTTLMPILLKVASTFIGIAAQILPAVVTVISALLPPIMQLVSSLLPILVKLFAAIAPVLIPVATLLGTLVKAVLPILTKVLLPILVALLKVLIPALTFLAKVLAAVIAGVVKFAAALIGKITGIIGWLMKNWPLVLAILTGPVGLAVFEIAKHWDGIKKIFTAAWGWVSGTFSKIWGGVSSVLSHPVDSAKAGISKLLGATGIRDSFTKLGSWTANTWSKGWAKAEGWVKHPIANGKAAIDSLLGSKGVRAAMNGLDSFGSKVFGKNWAGMKETISAPIRAAKDYLGRVFGKGGGGVRQIFSDFVTAAGKIFDKIKSAIAKPIGWVIDHIVNGALFKGINAVLGFVGMDKQKLKAIDTSGFASGGIFQPNRYTPGRDIGYAALSGYESIMRPEFTRAAGPAWVNAANAAARTGGVAGARAFLGQYAFGGIVRPINAAITQGIHDQYTGFPAVDAAASIGHPVVAGAAGRITRSYDIRGYESRNAVQNGFRSYGRVIEMQNNGFKTLYAHLSQRQARVGAMVKAGQQIGLSGNSGHSTGPHLHFGAAGKSPTDFWQGTFGKIIGALGGALGGIVDMIDPVKAIKGAVSAAMPGLRAFGTSPLVTMLSKLGPALADRAVDFARDKILGGISNPGGAGVERWRGTVRQALAMNGMPTSNAYVNAWLRQIGTESGGNPNAIQGISDINSANGNLARGLAQVIPSTFAAYAFPGHNNWASGLDSLLAGINYWKHAYGGNIGVIGQGHGYDSGGFLPPGLSINYNGLGRREPQAVFTPDQWETLRSIANGRGGNGGGQTMRLVSGELRLTGDKAFIRDAVVEIIETEAGSV